MAEIPEYALNCDRKCVDHVAHGRDIARHDDRLDQHGREIDGIQKCLERLVTLQEKSDKWQENMTKTVEELKHQPAARWNQLVTAGISAIVGAAVSLLSTSIMLG